MNLIITFDVNINYTDFPDIISNFISKNSEHCWIINRYTYLINTCNNIEWWNSNLTKFTDSEYPFILIDVSIEKCKGLISDEKWKFLNLLEKIELRTNTILNKIYSSEDTSSIIYEYINNLVSRLDYEGLNRFLKSVDLNKLKLADAVLILSSTFNKKEHLPHRRSFFKEVKRIYSDDNTLMGLN